MYVYIYIYIYYEHHYGCIDSTVPHNIRMRTASTLLCTTIECELHRLYGASRLKTPNCIYILPCLTMGNANCIDFAVPRDRKNANCIEFSAVPHDMKNANCIDFSAVALLLLRSGFHHFPSIMDCFENRLHTQRSVVQLLHRAFPCNRLAPSGLSKVHHAFEF